MNEAFQRLLAEAASAVEATIDTLLSPQSAPHIPERLRDAMRYATLGGGKRLRPFLLVEAARLFGAGGEGVLRAAAALECVHCYSLVHDDLPAMDDDDLRRGRPTVHRVYDEATAILAGDALLTFAFELMADPATDADPSIRAALVTGLARAAGAAGMVGGQALDMAGEGKAMTEAEIVTLQAMKTGALFRHAVDGGAILGRANEAEASALHSYGAALGAAFQLADDLLDHTGNTVTLGKVAARDAERNKPTLVALLGEDAARSRLAARIAEAEAALAPFGARAEQLVALARFVGGRG